MLVDPDGEADFPFALTAISPQREASCRDAIADGGESAWVELGMPLAIQQRANEAEACFPEAVNAGEFEMLMPVAMLIVSQPEREQQAERTLRLAAVAGRAEASLLLGALLSDEPDRAQEAEDASAQPFKVDWTAAGADSRRCSAGGSSALWIAVPRYKHAPLEWWPA